MLEPLPDVTFWLSKRFFRTYFEIYVNNFEITVKKPLDLNAVAEKLREEAVDDPDAIPDEEETEEDATPAPQVKVKNPIYKIKSEFFRIFWTIFFDTKGSFISESTD